MQVLQQHGREVAAMCPPVQGRRAVTAAKDQPFLRKETRVGAIMQVKRNGVEASRIMAAAQDVGRDGDVFTAVVRCAAALRVPSHGRGPQHVFLSVNHPFDERVQVFVTLKRDTFAKGVVPGDFYESITFPPNGVACLAEQVTQLLPLDVDSPLSERFDCVLSSCKKGRDDFCPYVHVRLRRETVPQK